MNIYNGDLARMHADHLRKEAEKSLLEYKLRTGRRTSMNKAARWLVEPPSWIRRLARMGRRVL